MDPTAPDDDVYPLHGFDATKQRRIFVTRVLRFNDVLDAEVLRASLSKLLEIGDWRKLGGCVRYTNNGKLEIRVPKRYTAKRPALTFTHDRLQDVGIEEHPEACWLHHPTDGPSIQAVSAHHPLFASRPDSPRTLDDMIGRGLPQLLLHVTSFKDATLVSLTWPHTVADALGIAELLRNWSLVLADRAEEVQSILGAREDVLLEAENSGAESEREDFELLPKRLIGQAMVKWASRHLWHHIRSPSLQTKTVFLPKETLNKLKSQIQKEIDDMLKEDNQENFATENDMLTAWVTQIVAVSEPTVRPRTILSLLNVRPLLSQVAKSGGVYIQNMLVPTYSFISPQLLKGPTGPVAVAHRRQFQKQCREQQILSFLRILRRGLDKGGLQQHIFGEEDSRPIFFNNLFKAEFLKAADFRPAVLRAGDGSTKRSNPPGTAIAYYYRVFDTPLDKLTSFYMLCKDHAGNCWLQGHLRPADWAEMQSRLDKLMS